MTTTYELLPACVLLCAMSLSALAQAPDGLLAEWRFDEGKGDEARDATGHGYTARLHGAGWMKQGSGFALRLDGDGGYVDCTAARKLPVEGPVAFEAWIMPTRKARGEAGLLGEGLRSFLMSWYNTELCFFYIGHGGNHLKEHLVLNRWQHVAASFDGERMSLWINGRMVGSRRSEVDDYKTGGTFAIGSPGDAGSPQFKGLVDNVRVYNRPLTEQTIVKHVKAEAPEHGVPVVESGAHDTEWTTRFFESHSNPIDVEERDDQIVLANRRIGLAFMKSRQGFRLDRLYGVREKQDYLVAPEGIGTRDLFELRMTPDLRGSGRDERGKTKGSLMGIMDEMASDAFSIGSDEAQSVSWRHEKEPGQVRVRLNWHRIPVRGNSHLVDVEVTVTLREDDPMSYWRIKVLNPGTRFGIERVRFPLLLLAPIGDPTDNVYIYPREHGGLVEDPFNAPTGFGVGFNTRGAYYPVDFNMQFQALYDKSGGHGIYLATHDPTPNLMHMRIANTPKQIAWRPGHFPPNITFAEEDYELPYDVVVGPFVGDWWDAAQIYRAWAVKQSWCRKGPLLTRSDVPRWYKESPFVFYTTIADSAEGTHSMEENMVIAADHFRQFLKWADMPLAAKWYGWKELHPDLTTYDVPFGSHRFYHQGRWRNLPPMNIHDGNYPTLGALKTFTEQTRKLRREGGMVCPYVALEIFDQGPDENSPLAREARPHVVRDLFGVKRTWGSETSWQMCTSSNWWQQRMRETCDEMVKREHVGGFYLDVMQGAGLPCYWSPHGHSAAGGDAITTGMHQTVEGCFNAAKARDPETIITGENSTENVIDVIDGTLTVTLWPENHEPIFAAVYQDYVKRYGTEMMTGVGWRRRFEKMYDEDGFYIEAAWLFVQGAQIGRIRLKPRDASLSFENPQQQGMFDFLSRVLGYYKQSDALKFLAYGRLMRTLTFAGPDPMPQMQYKRGGTFPAVRSGVFRAADRELGVFIVNAHGDELSYRADFDPGRYELPKDAKLDVDQVTPEGARTSVAKGARGVVTLSGSLPGRHMTMFHVRTAGQ